MICTEYQTSSEMFRALQSLSISTSPLNNCSEQLLQFYGSYTIVAASDIDNLQRFWLLATELSAKELLPFQFVSTHISTQVSVWHGHLYCVVHRFEPPLSLTGDGSIQTLCFACTCTAASTSQSHRNDENVPATSTNHPFITSPLCGGVLTLKSLVDKTHPLGVPGQHIVVRLKPLPPLNGHRYGSKTRV